MNWETRVPEYRRSLLGPISHTKALCATTDTGEYVIEHHASGKFGVSLDGVALTGLTFDTARAAMQAAEEDAGLPSQIDERVGERLETMELRINALYFVVGQLAQQANLDGEQVGDAFMKSEMASIMDDIRGQDWTLRVAVQVMSLVNAEGSQESFT